MSASVLITHPENKILSQLRAVIEESGLDSTSAADVDKAAQSIRINRPDLILVDGELVRKDPALCGKLRRNCPEKYLPVILLIPQDAQDVSSYLCGTSADDYITQPFSIIDLQTRLMLRLSRGTSKPVTTLENIDFGFLAGLSSLAVTDMSSSEVLQQVVEAISKVIKVRRCSITMVRENSDCGYVMAASDNPDVNGLEIELSRYPEILETLRTGKPLLIDNICQHPLMEPVRPYIEKLAFNSILVLPMVDRKQIVGVLVLRTARSIVGFTEEEIGFCQMVVNVATSALRSAEISRREAQRTVKVRPENTDIDHLSRQRSSLLGMAAHDLRVLVSVIDGYCLLLGESDQGNLTTEQNEIVAGLMTGSRRLIDMANNLLDYSRIEAGRFDLSMKQQDICEILSSIYGEMLPLMHRRGIRMNVDFLNQEMTVRCDEQGVRRVFYNIISNALKYTPDNGNIKLELSQEEKEVRFSVEDNGPGIAPKMLATLFDEFHCTPDPDGRPGNGLGLSICKKIVEAHRGRIWVESSLGQGSRFTVCLPV